MIQIEFFLTANKMLASEYAYMYQDRKSKRDEHGRSMIKEVPAILKVKVYLHELDEVIASCFGSEFQIFSADVPDMLKSILLSKGSYKDKQDALVFHIYDVEHDFANEWSVKGKIDLSRIQLLENSVEDLSDKNYKEFIMNKGSDMMYIYGEVPKRISDHPYIMESQINLAKIMVQQDPTTFDIIENEKIKNDPQVQKAYLDLDFWVSYAAKAPHMKDRIPKELIQHPRIQSALNDLSSWKELIGWAYYRLDELPSHIQDHPEIQKAYINGVRRDLMISDSIQRFYRVFNALPIDIQNHDLIKKTEEKVWRKILENNPTPFPFFDYWERTEVNKGLMSVMHGMFGEEEVNYFLNNYL